MTIFIRLLFVSILLASASVAPVFAETPSNPGEQALMAGPTGTDSVSIPSTVGPSSEIIGSGPVSQDPQFPIASSVSESPNTPSEGIEKSESRALSHVPEFQSQAPVVPASHSESGYIETSGEKDNFILPEAAQTAVFSSMDINRIVCQADIKDVVYSKEKNVRVAFAKNNAFIKFMFAVANGKEDYPKKPVEFFVICGDDVYNIIALPRRVPAQTIHLSSGKKKKIRENASIFGGMPIEKKVLQFIKFAYTDSMPESVEVDRPRKRYRIFSDLALVLDRTASIEGEGLLLKEFTATNATANTMRLDEPQFLLPDITTRTLAIALSKPTLNKGESSRIFIVETSEGGQNGRP